MAETTSLGAAMAAGNAQGVGVWDLDNIQSVPSDEFVPAITENRTRLLTVTTFYKI